MNTLKEVPHLGAIDHAIEVLRACFDHPEADEAIAGLKLLREQTAWAHHTPALLSGADAAADLAGVARPGAEPFGHVTVKRVQHHADRYEFFPAGQTPYLDNVDECHAVYTTPPQASQPEARPRVEPYAYAVYFPDEPREELVHKLDDLLDDLTNCTNSVAPLYKTPQASQPEPALAAQPGAAGLSEEQIKRHSLLAADCPGASTVILVSSLRRLLASAPTPEPMSAPTAEPDERSAFEAELSKQCFQKPTPEAYDLAWCMWKARASKGTP